MNQRIDFTQLGGYPMTQNSLDFMQQSYRNAFGALANFIGSATILTGVVVNTANNTVSDGWICYNGEMMPFLGGGLAPGVVVQETSAALSFQNGDSDPVKFTKVATCGAPATFQFSALKAPQSLRDVWCTGDIKQVDCTIDYINANFDMTTGLGLNERLGWAYCDGRNNTKDRRGLVSVSWDNRAIDPGTGLWDVAYNTPGAVGGALKRILTMLNIPKHNHLTHAVGEINPPFDFLSISDPHKRYSGGGSGDNFGASQDPDQNMQTGFAGGDVNGNTTPFDIRQPFIVTLEIQKL